MAVMMNGINYNIWLILGGGGGGGGGGGSGGGGSGGDDGPKMRGDVSCYLGPRWKPPKSQMNFTPHFPDSCQMLIALPIEEADN